MLIQPLTFTGTSNDMASVLTSNTIKTSERWGLIQVWWTGTPYGTLGLQISSDVSHWNQWGRIRENSNSREGSPMSSEPDFQPAGSPGNATIIMLELLAPYFRVVYTPASGGAGA